MIDVTTIGLIVGSIMLTSSVVIVVIVYLQRKLQRTGNWQSSNTTPSVISSAPTSRRSSSSCLVNLEKQHLSSRTRSASFGEDLTARLQALAAGSCYRSYAATTTTTITIANSSLPRSSLSSNMRLPVVSRIAQIIPSKSNAPSITFQLRYEQSIETLFIMVFQLNDFLTIKNTQNIYIILYLLPNDDEQHQTKSSINGVFNECFHFQIKSNNLLTRILRLTAYRVDSVTRIRHIIGHVFVNFDRFTNDTNTDKTFSTNTLVEYLTQDLRIQPNYLGQLVLTACYLKDQNLIHICIKEIKHLQINQTQSSIPIKAHFSGQTSNNCNKYHWTNTSSFSISSSSFHINQELKLTTYASSVSTNDNYIKCHLRLHLHNCNQIHSHVQWKHSTRSTTPQTYTLSLVAS